MINTDSRIIRLPQYKERLSGDTKLISGGYPEILVFDGRAKDGGTLVCSLRGFKYCDVVLTFGYTTELQFPGKVSIAIRDANVQYAE